MPRPGGVDQQSEARVTAPFHSKAGAMTRMLSGEIPPIYLIDFEAEALSHLATGAARTMPDVSELLLSEIARGESLQAERIRPDAVTMHSFVEFVDEAGDVSRTVQIVYPAQADFASGRISILTPIAAGLIGLREGQSLGWLDRDGHKHKLTVCKVTQPCRI